MLPNDTTEDRPPTGYLEEKLGTVMLDWSVLQQTSPALCDSEMLATVSCCQATSNRTLQWYANPDEDHTDTLGRLGNAVVEEGETSIEFSDDKPSPCPSCQEDSQSRNTWGLVLHPGPTPGSFFRTGVFILWRLFWDEHLPA